MLFNVPEGIIAFLFIVIWLLLALAAMIVASSRTGIVSYSLLSMIKESDQKPTWEVDKSKRPRYLKLVALTAVITALLMLIFDTNVQDIAIAVGMNTAVVAWGGYYWILCKTSQITAQNKQSLVEVTEAKHAPPSDAASTSSQ